MPTRSRTLLIAALAVLALHAVPARAQAPRTWVSALGDDSNPCSRVAPCRSYPGALTKTAAGGEISTIDSGAYVSMSITKSISIEAIGVEGGILASTTGVVINAGATDIVHLDGLVFEGAGSGQSAVRILSAGQVHIRGCLIRNFRGSPGLGIEIAPTATTKVFISDCAITGNSGGVSAKPNGGAAQVFLNRVRVEGNAGVGVLADGKTVVIRLNNSVIAGNGTGLNSANGASILSFDNNSIAGNNADGSPTGTLKPM
jgi:hypothetical protein